MNPVRKIEIAGNSYVYGSTSLPSFQKGTYLLILYLAMAKEIRIGKLGTFEFKKGYYAYIGSAFCPGGLSARINHHLEVTHHPHWHIDYLRKYASIYEIWICEQEIRLEHRWADILRTTIDNASIPAPGFGSSDCMCETHLFYFRKKSDLHVLSGLSP